MNRNTYATIANASTKFPRYSKVKKALCGWKMLTTEIVILYSHISAKAGLWVISNFFLWFCSMTWCDLIGDSIVIHDGKSYYFHFAFLKWNCANELKRPSERNEIILGSITEQHYYKMCCILPFAVELTKLYANVASSTLRTMNSG